MNKYQIISLIDQGTYGIVYKAINKTTRQQVAIKQFKHSDQNPIIKQSIHQQIKMLLSLKGQSVIQLKQAFKRKGKVFLILQCYQKSLLQLFKIYYRGIHIDKVSSISYGLFKCIYDFHKKNILHRDLKPQNILVGQLQNQNGQIIHKTKIKFCDLGFAKQIPQKGYLTQYVGTRWYRSPQLIVGQSYGKQNDIWAIGCIISQMILGKPLFPGKTQIQQLFLIRQTLGQLSKMQEMYFKKNPKFYEISLEQFQQKQKLLKHKSLKEKIKQKKINVYQDLVIDLIQKCLKMNPKQRITAQQALKHPFIFEHFRQEQYQRDLRQKLQERQRQKRQIRKRFQQDPFRNNTKDFTIYKRKTMREGNIPIQNIQKVPDYRNINNNMSGSLNNSYNNNKNITQRSQNFGTSSPSSPLRHNSTSNIKRVKYSNGNSLSNKNTQKHYLQNQFKDFPSFLKISNQNFKTLPLNFKLKHDFSQIKNSQSKFFNKMKLVDYQNSPQQMHSHLKPKFKSNLCLKLNLKSFQTIYSMYMSQNKLNIKGQKQQIFVSSSSRSRSKIKNQNQNLDQVQSQIK